MAVSRGHGNACFTGSLGLEWRRSPLTGAAAWPKGKSENGGFREIKWEWGWAARALEGEGQAGGDLSGSVNGAQDPGGGCCESAGKGRMDAEPGGGELCLSLWPPQATSRWWGSRHLWRAPCISRLTRACISVLVQGDLWQFQVVCPGLAGKVWMVAGQGSCPAWSAQSFIVTYG